MNLKKKAAGIKRCQEATGGGPELNIKLSDIESRVLSLLGNTFYAGCGVQEHGVSLYFMLYKYIFFIKTFFFS